VVQQQTDLLMLITFGHGCRRCRLVGLDIKPAVSCITLFSRCCIGLHNEHVSNCSIENRRTFDEGVKPASDQEIGVLYQTKQAPLPEFGQAVCRASVRDSGCNKATGRTVTRH
jgi:hypothetical protein